MKKIQNDIPDAAAVAAEYGFTELPTVADHRNFILDVLRDRYIEARDKKDAYVAIVHRNSTEHYIVGVYDDLREALQTRFVANSILSGGNKFGPTFMMIHHVKGDVIGDKIYDAKTNTVMDFDPDTDDE